MSGSDWAGRAQGKNPAAIVLFHALIFLPLVAANTSCACACAGSWLGKPASGDPEGGPATASKVGLGPPSLTLYNVYHVLPYI